MSSQQGRHYKYKRVEFYAERGLITVIDEDIAADSQADAHNAIKRIAPRTFMTQAIQARITGDGFYPNESRLLTKMLEDVAAAVKDALIQGDPTDPAVMEHHARHKRRSSIMMPSEVNQLLGPVGGARYALRSDTKDPRQLLLGGGNQQVVPDFTIKPSDWVTPKRVAAARLVAATGRQR